MTETLRCYVCAGPVQPDGAGQVRLEGITEPDKSHDWVWGPVVVHEDCRVHVTTPYDEEIGGRYCATWEKVPLVKVPADVASDPDYRPRPGQVDDF